MRPPRRGGAHPPGPKRGIWDARGSNRIPSERGTYKKPRYLQRVQGPAARLIPTFRQFILPASSKKLRRQTSPASQLGRHNHRDVNLNLNLAQRLRSSYTVANRPMHGSCCSKGREAFVSAANTTVCHTLRESKALDCCRNISTF